MTPSTKSKIEEYKNFCLDVTLEVAKHIDHTDVIITGSTFANFFHDESDVGDIDLFPLTTAPVLNDLGKLLEKVETDKKVAEKKDPRNSNDIVDTLFDDNDDNNSTIYTAIKIATINGINISLITNPPFLRSTPRKTVECFDFFHAMNYYQMNDHKFFINSQVLFVIKNKILLINDARRGAISKKRIKRFEDRGYTLMEPKTFKRLRSRLEKEQRKKI